MVATGAAMANLVLLTKVDCSNRGGVILAPLSGSGTTSMAAERTGR